MESCKRRTKPPKKTLSEYREEFFEQQAAEWDEAYADWCDDGLDVGSLYGGVDDWLDFADTSVEVEQFDPRDHYDEPWYDDPWLGFDDHCWPDEVAHIDTVTQVPNHDRQATKSLGEILKERAGEFGL